MQAEGSGLAMAERNYETVPALRGAAVWETKLDQGDNNDDHDDGDDDDDDDDGCRVSTEHSLMRDD